jgi:hypothetical protein
LPGSIEGASLAAFRAPIPVPTNEESDDDDYGFADIVGEEQDDDYDDIISVAADVEEQRQVPASAPTSESSLQQQPSSSLSKKLASLQERTLPAVLMLGGAGLWSYYLKEDGLILLTLVLQIGMYQEMTKVIGGDFPHKFYKWWWFATMSLAVNLPRILPWATDSITAVAYGMTMIGLLSTIVQFNWRNSPVEEFREYLRQAAVSFLAMVSNKLSSSCRMGDYFLVGNPMIILCVCVLMVDSFSM